MSGRRVRPLAARHFLLRNPRRVLPVAGILALSTALVLGVVTPLSSFEATYESEIRSLSAYTALTPMGARAFDADLRALLASSGAIKRTVEAKAFWISTPLVIGEGAWPFLALERADQDDFLARVGDRLASGGRMPTPDTEEAVIHRDLARARGLSIGSSFGRLADPQDTTPGRYRIVGLLEGDARLGLFDLRYASRSDFVLARQDPFLLVYAKPGRKAESDRFLHEARDARGRPAFRVTDEAYVRGRTRKLLRNLPLVVDAVVGALTAVLALVVALLHVLAFQAREDEFGLLLAVGRTRARLAGKLAVETAGTAAAGLLVGLAVGYAWLAVYTSRVLDPLAIRIRFVDPYALVLSCALPVVAAAASSAAMAWRLARLDPVQVIQRRNA